MGERLEKIILNFAPPNWKSGRDTIQLDKMSPEFKEMEAEFSGALVFPVSINSIKRHEDVFNYGQFLFREQQLLHLSPGKAYYRVSKS